MKLLLVTNMYGHVAGERTGYQMRAQGGRSGQSCVAGQSGRAERALTRATGEEEVNEQTKKKIVEEKKEKGIMIFFISFVGELFC